ncbi:MAG TPA: hypothetical protein VNK23_11555 [Candidatus Dormibacteraeota bacterium]|nr:hypothetical protein [Candidatus Dormibacteraeota bacterium]
MDTLHLLFVSWGVVTAALICVLIYRSTLSTREGDQIFLDASENTMANEQRAIVARLEKLSVPITALIVISGALLLAIAGFWLWQGFKSF